MPVSWRPVVSKLELLIHDEEARIEKLKLRPVWTPPVSEDVFTQEMAMPQLKEVPPEFTSLDLPVSESTEFRWQPSTELFPSEPDMPRASIEMQQATQTPDWIRKEIGAPAEEVQWWEKPKEVSEQAMEQFGKAVSKVPVLPKALEFIAPVFEFIHEKLEKPWAAIITSPLSPSLPIQQGENWLEWKKREYDTWKAPTYVKGVAEFSMPLWWMPWFTWFKGIKATATGAKLARGLRVPGKLILPTKEVLNAGFKDDWFRSLAHWAENKPVIHGVVKAVGGEAAFARNVGEVFPAMDIATRKLVVVNRAGAQVAATDFVRREIINRAVIEDMRYGYAGIQLPRLQSLAPRGDLVKALQIDDMGRMMSAVPKEGNKLGRGISEVFEHPDLYTYTSKQTENIVREGNKVLTEIFDLARSEGVKVSKDPFLHRMVKGVEKQLPDDKTIFEASEFGSKFEKSRHFKTMEEGIAAYAAKGQKLVYGNDPLESISATINHYFKRIGQQRFDSEVGKLGRTIPEMVSLVEPNLIENMAALGTKIGSASYLSKTLRTLKSYRGDSIPGAVSSKIRRGMPEAMERIEQAFSLTPKETTVLMDALAKTIGEETKISARNLKIMMGQFNRQPGKILAREVDDLVRSLNLTNETANKAIRQAYKATYQSRKQIVDDTLKAVRKEADEVIKATKSKLAPLKADYRRIARHYEGYEILGEGLAKFKMHPAFAKKVFDADVVKMVENQYAREGGKWTRNIAQASSIGRVAIAAMDFSAPFIQGLAVLGRNPVAWAKAVGQQFRFFVKPDDFFQYMMQPKIRALAAERWAHGGSRSTFEFFQALEPIQRQAGRVPKVGSKLVRGIQETYGRAEVAFSGFGEAARNYMWEALRVKALQADGTLNTAIARELARSIDRMTGVISMEALGMTRGQIDFESAWVFFAPRYSRAGMSYVADMMKGGIAGAEARKSLGSLMAAGMTYYYGITTAMGQQPNLNINSPRFMTVKIGDDYVGVGGVFYSLARLQANVIGTALDEPADFLSLSRVDNPFIKFMYSRSSAMTGAIGSIIEQKNYFGEPIESIGDWGKFMAEKALPIAMQRAILEPEHRNPAVFTAELLGGRTFPKSAWELQEETKDRLAQSEHGLSYDQLDLLSKRQIDKHPDVTRFQEEIDTQTTRRGKALSVAFLERGRDLDDARFLHKEQVENAARAFDAGMITGYEFRQVVRDADIGYGSTYTHINQNARYKEVMDKLQEPREVNREYRWELAYDEMIQATSSNMFENEFGIFDFQGYRDFMDSLKIKYGEPDFNRAMAMKNEKYAEYPELFQELQVAKEIMRPYWEVRNQVVKLFGERFAESPRGQSLISKRRKSIRLRSRDIEQAYQRFYAQQ